MGQTSRTYNFIKKYIKSQVKSSINFYFTMLYFRALNKAKMSPITRVIKNLFFFIEENAFCFIIIKGPNQH